MSSVGSLAARWKNYRNQIESPPLLLCEKNGSTSRRPPTIAGAASG